MAEIEQQQNNNSSNNNNDQSNRIAESIFPSTSDHSNNQHRSTPPGTKRLFLSLSVLLSFLVGLPFLLQSTAIHRAPLPISSSSSLPQPLLPLNLNFHALFLRRNSSDEESRNLHSSISTTIKSRIKDQLQFSLSITISFAGDCKYYGDNRCDYRCSAADVADFDAVARSSGGDEAVDEYLNRVVNEGSNVYTVVVVEGEGEVRAVVGKYRHGWVMGRNTMAAAAELAGGVFAYFVNAGKDVGKGDYVPVGSDGNLVLSFSLLNANPNDWVYDWEFDEVGGNMLGPVVEALTPIANISIESQALYHTPKSFTSRWNDKVNGYSFSTSDLPFFVNSNEWHLDTSIAASGRSKVLQFVVYIPSASECPLLLGLQNGELSKTNAFVSPMWGGVVVWNPPSCHTDSERDYYTKELISTQDLQNIFHVFIGQLRVLFGLRTNDLPAADVGISNFLTCSRGFAQWELDMLYRHHTSFNLQSSVATLDSLSKLVQSLPRMIVLDEIGKQVEFSLKAAKVAQQNASAGVYNASAVSSKKARALAEDAFFHPSIMSISYASIEHYSAIYMPFFAPVSLHVLVAVLYELKRYRKERKKYFTFLSSQAKPT